MFRGDEPTGRKWVELVDWRTTADDPELGGQYSLIQPLTTILPPRLLVLDLSSSNTNPEVANSGDNVTLRIVASRSIYRPTVSIGGIPAILELSGDSDQGSSSFSGAQWVAYRQIIRSEGEGELDIQVEFEDLFGNVRMVDELSSGSIRVRVDSSRPTASVVAVDDVPENGGFFGPITLTRLFLLVTFSEPVSDVDESKITIDNGSISGLSQISNSTWRFQVTIGRSRSRPEWPQCANSQHLSPIVLFCSGHGHGHGSCAGGRGSRHCQRPGGQPVPAGVLERCV